ncbi:hypothetical protein ES703_45555 [subsurface metagenome]
MTRTSRKAIFVCIFFFLLIFINSSISITALLIKNSEINHPSLAAEVPGERQWINNPSFESQEYWFKEYEGDNTDIDGKISGNQTNFKIIGERWTYSNISGTPNATHWTPGKESVISILPDIYEINSFGCNATHEYWESSGINIYGVQGNQSRNNPIIHWNRIVNMPYDMRDYSITSAELTAIFNASADINLETPYESIEGEPNNGYAAEYDHARFYVLLSDLNKVETYEAAHNQTKELGSGYWPRLGRGGRASASKVNDTYMKTVDKDELIFYLNRVLSHNYQDFRVTLGIDIYNEDNYASAEIDTWYYLLIKSCNLTFDYEKKINRFSSISWKQNCEKISDLSEYPVIVQNATLNFHYKIDQLWNTSLSPNSEIRILINDNKHTETVKLSTATTSFQEAKVGGFDVSNLITDDVNLSLQVYLADDFVLDQNITISIDDVSLDISYIIIEPDEPIEKGPDWSWLVYTLTAGIIGIITVFSLYQIHFKYPPLVRKIRKLKKGVKKGKIKKSILVNKREDIIKHNLNKSKNILVLESTQHDQVEKIEKISINKEEEL